MQYGPHSSTQAVVQTSKPSVASLSASKSLVPRYRRLEGIFETEVTVGVRAGHRDRGQELEGP
eukprot:1035596-Rhodomonas_salina.2